MKISVEPVADSQTFTSVSFVLSIIFIAVIGTVDLVKLQAVLGMIAPFVP